MRGFCVFFAFFGAKIWPAAAGTGELARDLRDQTRGGSEYGAEGRLGWKGVLGGTEYGAQGTPRHTDLHFDPQATTFRSPPGGIYLIIILRNVL